MSKTASLISGKPVQSYLAGIAGAEPLLFPEWGGGAALPLRKLFLFYACRALFRLASIKASGRISALAAASTYRLILNASG